MKEEIATMGKICILIQVEEGEQTPNDDKSATV